MLCCNSVSPAGTVWFRCCVEAAPARPLALSTQKSILLNFARGVCSFMVLFRLSTCEVCFFVVVGIFRVQLFCQHLGTTSFVIFPPRVHCLASSTLPVSVVVRFPSASLRRPSQCLRVLRVRAPPRSALRLCLEVCVTFLFVEGARHYQAGPTFGFASPALPGISAFALFSNIEWTSEFSGMHIVCKIYGNLPYSIGSHWTLASRSLSLCFFSSRGSASSEFVISCQLFMEGV